jgi:hypothetical protein
VRFEGEDNAAALSFSGLFDDLSQKILVGQMNPVKIPDGRNRTFNLGGDPVQAPDDIHESISLSFQYPERMATGQASFVTYHEGLLYQACFYLTRFRGSL